MNRGRKWERWRTVVRLLAGLLVTLTTAAGTIGCSRHGKAAPVGGSDIPPSKVNLKRNVDLARAEQRSLVYYVDTVGVLEAEGQTDIAAGVTGIVDEVLFREGDLVDSNTVLVRVDQKRYVSAAKIAEANVLRAEKNVDLAVDQYERAFTSRQGSSEEEKAKARLNRGIADAELLSARANLVMAKNNLDRSQVRPPYAGRINQRKITPGMYLEEKTVIATMADLSRIRLVGYVPETATPVVRELMAAQEQRARAVRLTVPLSGWLAGAVPWGSVAGFCLLREDRVPSGYDPEFTLLAYPQQTFTGRIFYISTVASPDTHMFECKAEVNLRGLSNIELKPGYTARIRIPLRSNAQACVVPEEAVRASEQGFIAFVPTRRVGRDGQSEWVAKARSLEIGFRSPGWVEVRRGIQAGEWLVRRGAEALEDGTPIRIPDPQMKSIEPAREVISH